MNYRMCVTAEVCFTVEAESAAAAVREAESLAERWVLGLDVKVFDGKLECRVYLDEGATPEVVDLEECVKTE